MPVCSLQSMAVKAPAVRSLSKSPTYPLDVQAGA